jgi:Fe-S cluster assembly protein SufD
MGTSTKATLQSFRSNLSAAKLALPSVLTAKNEGDLSVMEFPTSKHEAWKYTRLNRVAKIELESNVASPINWEDFNMVKDAYTFVFQNTTCIYISSDLPEGISIKIGNEIGSADWLSSINESHVAKLNVAHAQNGCVINIAKGVQVDKPIQIIYITDGPKQPNFWRNQLQLDAGAKAEVHIGYFSKDAIDAYSNVHWSVFLKENSHLIMTKIQNDGEANFHFSTENIHQLKDSNFTLNTMTLNGAFVRNDLLVKVEGENCETHLNGAYVMKGNQHVDNHTTIDHIFPNCNSYELYKGVMGDKSTAVFNGKVFVRPDAQKINAFQSNANVLLSDDATINSKPELEIYADDVKCSHGSTTGQLDLEAVFYLRSRGISEIDARSMVVAAFMHDVLSKVASNDIKSYIYQQLAVRFNLHLQRED